MSKCLLELLLPFADKLVNQWPHAFGFGRERVSTHAGLESMDRLVGQVVARQFARDGFGGIGFTLDFDIQLYFRRAKMEDKYALHRAGPSGPFKIIAFSGVRGVSPRLVDDREFSTLDEAYHAVFMRRVPDLLES